MAASNTASDTRLPLVEADRFSYAYPGAPDWVLREISLYIHPGELHLLQGPTGCGKSTLLLAIGGLLPPGQQTGKMRRFPADTDNTRPHPGLLLQNPKTQLLWSSLGADIAFGLENHGLDPAAMPGMVRRAMKSVGLDQPVNRSVEALSMGQQYRACLAGILVMQPLLVMLDEPMAQLDCRGQNRLLTIVRDLKHAGRAVLICDHRPGALVSTADHTWKMDDRGHIRETTGRHRPAAASMRLDPKGEKRQETGPSSAPRHPHRSTRGSEDPIVRVAGLKFSLPNGELDLSALSLRVSRGECVAVYGANGTGKTSLVDSLSGLRRPTTGTAEVFGSPPRLKDLRGRMTILYQDPRRQLFETTVFDEVAFSAHRSGRPDAQVRAMVNRLLGGLRLSHLAGVSPHRLSYGQKHLVGLAAVLAAEPELVLLDDPFAGLDTHRTGLVMNEVAAIARAWKTTVIWTTHDPRAAARWADRVIELPCRKPDAALETDPAASATASSGLGNTHRLPGLDTGIMLGLCLILSMSAFAARSPGLLAILTGIDLFLIGSVCPAPMSLLRKSAGFFFWQAAMVTLLYIIRFGIQAGVVPGIQVSWQLFLALWPPMLFMAANAQSEIVAALSRVMPHRMAFVAATCLRFMPLLLSEMQQIRAAQTLRGARLLATDLKRPRYWPDWIHCLMVPALVKTLSLAGDIATAATARDFGIQPERTAWPGE